jgi:hypothetical protein
MTIDEKCRILQDLKDLIIPVWLFSSVILIIWGSWWRARYSIVIKWLGIVLFLCFISYIVTLEPQIKDGEISGESVSKSFIRKIHDSLEAYSNDHDSLYPEDISALIPDYLGSMPENVYTAEPMKDIEFGSEPWEGDFSYEPVYTGSEITDYLLYLYGSKYEDGMDMDNDGIKDHVITVLSSDNDDEEGHF